MGERARDFVTDEQELPCGYAPRTIQYSLASDTLFVGCKDGTITVVDGLTGDGATSKPRLRHTIISARDPDNPGKRLSSVRSLAEWCPGWLLVGRDDGRIHLVNWREVVEESQEPRFHSIFPSGSNRISYLEWLNKELLLVSLRNAETYVVRCGPQRDSRVESWASNAFRRRKVLLPKLKNVVSSVPFGEKRRWLQISKDGTAWITEENNGRFSSEVQSWQEVPGFVTDFAVIKPPYRQERERTFDYREQVSDGVYISTDSGVYLVSSDQEPPRPLRIALPGVGRMCLAITYFADAENRYLWVSDSAGDAHLFWSPPGPASSPDWQRSGIRHDASQVTLGFSSWRTLAGYFVVGQARRNNIVISRYRSGAPGPEATGRMSPRWLLRYGDVDSLRDFVRSLDDDAEEWEPEAQLAEVFEHLGEDPERTNDLREFLRNPDARLAHAVLNQLQDPERSGRAVELWNCSLLGTVHRYRGSISEKESLHLGIIRWLRLISTLDLGCPEQEQRVWDVVQDQIVVALKWGVFGTSYTQWRNTALPSKVLEEQQSFDVLDHYAYESFLFQRQVELETEDTRGQRQGRTAWDLRTLKVGQGRYLVAVSWIWGGVELYQLSADEQGTYRFDLCVVFRPLEESALYCLSARNVKKEETPPASESDLDFGHCRTIVLGTLPGKPRRYYLLASPAQQTGHGSSTRFELWPLDLTQARVRVQEGTAPFSAPLCQEDEEDEPEVDESVYSLLEVEPGLILAGLRGHKGIARVTTLLIDTHSTQLTCLKPARLAAPTPEGKSIARNNVWALAKEPPSRRNPSHTLFAGCGDGQVWKIEIPRGWRGESDLSETVAFVHRLGAPVWALACNTSKNGTSVIRRVFAGGADGTILAWQQLPDTRFTPVWATWEGDGPIARIHTFKPKDGEFPMVLAVTQQGRAVLFSDRADVEPTRGSLSHRRPKVPGERSGRIVLESSAFASELEVALIPRETGRPLARLISATNDGRLRVHCLRYPLHLPERREQYGKLVTSWLNMVCGPRRADSSRSYLNHRLRCAEVAYLASPIAPQVLVRGLLEHAEHSEAFELWQDAPPRGELHRQWVPRYLRPLLDLDRAWDDLDKEKVRKSLELALERSWRWNDRELFVEILTVILNRSNHWLCGTKQDLETVAEVYHEILDGLERSLKRWLGSPDRAEVRTRITYAKQLTDGDTLWRLGQRAEASDAARAILSDRLVALQALLVTGDPLLALETLRASNLAMIRLCRRLVEDKERAVEWRPEISGQEIPWNALDAYMRSVSDFAASAFHITQRVSDSLAHEIARAFALTVCCCPSWAIRIGHWLSEADLVSASARDDRAEEVLNQFKLLESLGVPVPEKAIRAFEWACRGGETLGDDAIAGKHNQQALAAVRPFEHILTWLSDLAKQLSSNASGIDLWKADDLRKSLRTIPRDDEYSHSRRFWDGALTSLIERRDRWRLALNRTRDVQPEIVLFSRELTAWCMETIESLDDRLRRHTLFQPQHSDYMRILRPLEEAAREFPQSAAIQKNIVIGILGHGLLESLDEHVLELEEIAQALDPLLVWEHRAKRENGRGVLPPAETPGSRAEHFARHLLARSLDAESIPKNLRSLQGLLDADEPEYKGTLQDLFAEFWPDLKISAASEPTPRELRFLRLALKELDQNDRRYGPWPREASWPESEIDGSIHLRFPLRVRSRKNSRRANDSIKENLKTLHSLMKSGLQQLVYPKDHRDTASHGTGLYLANLAAAVVGWRLTISGISPQEDWFSFELKPVYKGA